MTLPLPAKGSNQEVWLEAYFAIYQHYFRMVPNDRQGITWCHEMVESTLGPHWWHLFGPNERTEAGWKKFLSVAQSYCTTHKVLSQ